MSRDTSRLQTKYQESGQGPLPYQADAVRGSVHYGVGQWVIVAVVSVLLAFLIHSFFLQTYRISSSSMEPTLRSGDHVLVNRLIYGFDWLGKRRFPLRAPKRGDIVVFERETQRDEHFFVKRLVGVPGDTVQIKAHRLYLNDVLVDTPQSAQSIRFGFSEASPGRNFGPITLKPGEYFVLGDNRANSEDSRFFGPIQAPEIVGQAFMIYWSWVDVRTSLYVDWERIGRRVR